MAQTRQKRKKPNLAKGRNDASLYPLDPETAIRAILETGAHPPQERKPNCQRLNQEEDQEINRPRLVEGRGS